MSSAEYKINNEESINIINREINNNDILLSIINRFIIQGTQQHLHKIDLLVYGTPNDFLYITTEEIYSYILSKKNALSTAIHFYCLTYQPMATVLDYDEKKEYMRH